MSKEKCLKSIADSMNLNASQSLKVFDGFWEAISKMLASQGIVEIAGIGTFSLELDEKSKKEEYKVVFKPSASFVSEIIEGEGK
jgi:nucleoid DNA-binding protein